MHDIVRKTPPQKFKSLNHNVKKLDNIIIIVLRTDSDFR